MKSTYAYMLAGAMLAAPAGIQAQTRPPIDPGKNAGDRLEQIGSTLADEATAQAARTLLVSIVNDAATADKIDDLVGYLARADRNRIGKSHPKMDDLNRVIAQFRVDFRAKYNQDFEIRPEHFRDAIVYAGRDKNSATVSLPDLQFNRKLEPDHGNRQPLGSPAVGAKSDDAIKPKDLKASGESLTLNLINEGALVSTWHVNVPDQINFDQLKGNLIKHIQTLDDQKAVWPKDADAAYHAAAYQILQALNDSALVSER